MIVIFDLDYTLLDTKKFKEDLSGAFNMSPEEWAEDYKKFFKDKKINYNINLHIQKLKMTGRIATKKEERAVKQKINKFFRKINSYLFNGAEDILKNIKKRGDKAILATFGNKDYNKIKIGKLKIRKYFDKIIYEDENKADNKALRKIRGLNDDILIINDNAKESLLMLEALGRKARLFLLKGPYSKNIKHNKKIYSNINQLIKIV